MLRNAMADFYAAVLKVSSRRAPTSAGRDALSTLVEVTGAFLVDVLAGIPHARGTVGVPEVCHRPPIHKQGGCHPDAM